MQRTVGTLWGGRHFGGQGATTKSGKQGKVGKSVDNVGKKGMRTDSCGRGRGAGKVVDIGSTMGRAEWKLVKWRKRGEY